MLRVPDVEVTREEEEEMDELRKKIIESDRIQLSSTVSHILQANNTLEKAAARSDYPAMLECLQGLQTRAEYGVTLISTLQEKV